MISDGTNLFVRARACLVCCEVDEKLALAAALQQAWLAGRLRPEPAELEDVVDAGRPQQPRLVHPRELPRRSFATPEGRLALIHAVAHIEFNAINLACDALFRFQQMPRDYYGDWIRVAAEEAVHFQLLRERLRAAGSDYGAFDAHNGLWDMARRTADDPLVRMALVPRMLEARGLDVTPAMIDRFAAIGDSAMVDALSLILREEIGHVALGSRWFDYLCRQRGVDAEQTYFETLQLHLNGEIRCPLHLDARRQAGFSERELVRLQQLCNSGAGPA
ncbi:MAG: ferritin-like domain-containing protein [Gammaproteobacteria bacterium]|nr:ferritin-like domain-containing protein [Gammaproteobacteria bacterium]